MLKKVVGDLDVYYKIRGSGHPLLMVMGLSFSHLDWGDEVTVQGGRRALANNGVQNLIN